MLENNLITKESKTVVSVDEIVDFLPGYNCGGCGNSSCLLFAESVLYEGKEITACPLLKQERFKENRVNLEKLELKRMKKPLELRKKKIGCSGCGVRRDSIRGVLDKYEADIVLSPLDGEHSCREVLMPVTTFMEISVGDIVEYRPMGCPIVHYARVLKKEGMLITVHIVGPCDRDNRENATHKSVGICMVVGFEGKYKGKNIRVGETVRFLPDHCMMQKIHSGVVVNLEDENVLLEGIDLKVWAPPITV